MKPMSLQKVLMVLAVLLMLAPPAFAEFTEFESGVSPEKHPTSFGLGVAAVPDYEGSDDYTAAPLVLFRYGFEGGQFIDVLGNRAKANLLPSTQFQLGPVLQYRATRDDNVEDDQVKQMKKIDAAVEAGLFAGIDINDFLASVQVVHDVSDSYDGTLVTANVSYRLNATQTLTLVPGVSATWANDHYMETYFGVNSSNRGTSTLPNYNAEAGLKDITVAVLADYHPWQNWKIVGGAAFKSLLNDAKDSPVVDQQGDSSQWLVGALLAYTWR